MGALGCFLAFSLRVAPLFEPRTSQILLGAPPLLRILPETSQMPPRDLPDASQRPPRDLQVFAAKYSQPRLRSQGNAAKVTPQVTQSSLHSQGYLCDGYAAKVILLRLHIQGCIAEVTQPRIRSQGYAPGYTANLAQPMLRSQGYAPGYTSMLA